MKAFVLRFIKTLEECTSGKNSRVFAPFEELTHSLFQVLFRYDLIRYLVRLGAYNEVLATGVGVPARWRTRSMPGDAGFVARKTWIYEPYVVIILKLHSSGAVRVEPGR